MRKLLFVIVLLAFAAPLFAQSDALMLEPIGTYATGAFDEGAAEIVAYHAATQTLFVVDGSNDAIDLLDISDPTMPSLTTEIDLAAYGSGATHVSVYGDIVAIAVEGSETGDAGSVVFASPDGTILNAVEVGALPDQLIFTPDGSKVLTANEGEPSSDYGVDPEGSVSIVDISGGVENATVITINFADFNADGARAAELPAEVRVFGLNATVAQDLEPEYVAVSPDGMTAYVSLQENNAVAVIDIETATITAIRWLGTKDHSVEGNGADFSNEDGAIRIENWPVMGLYMPDALVAFEAMGATYLISANEGDARDYDGFAEEIEVSEQTFDAEVFPNAADFIAESELGKLEFSSINSDPDGDGDIDAIYAIGARSFTIWSADGELVFDSGDDFEQITAEMFPEEFNSTHDENGSFDDRSDNKGPEPEGVALGMVGEAMYAFIGLERIGGVMVYDITDPTAPVFVTYANNRDFAGDAAAGTAGDLGPEGLIFIPAASSPNGADLLVVANEISGTTTIYQISAS
ncbi:MAG: choice-of-anchor I family protein [Chloroflexota bacterium]|nr:choice-of-anchor I family protein [Chloroflexota bacterium]